MQAQANYGHTEAVAFSSSMSVAMGRSSGYRPKAANRKVVMALRERLAECRDDQWVKAQYIMDEITTALGVPCGPMRAKIEPRACKFCHYYGHTSQHCKKRQRMQSDVEAAEWRALQLHIYVPPKQEDVTPEQWAWICEVKDMQQRVDDALALGLGCTARTSAWKHRGVCEDQGLPPCDNCVKWKVFMDEREAAYSYTQRRRTDKHIHPVPDL